MSADVVVVGGGPAGSTVAWKLARRGARVCLMDAARFPRVKLCAGWVTHDVLADLELTPATYPHTIQPFDAVTVDVDGASHRTAWNHPAGFGIVRQQFDAWLLRRAAEAGVDVHEASRVRRIIETGPNDVLVETDSERVRAPLVVGAGGYQCPVARQLGDVRADEDVIVTQESETHVGAEALRALTPRYGVPELFAEPDFQGYGWYFTKGDYLNVGVGAQGGLRIADRLARLMERLRALGRLPARSLTPFRGHAYAVRRDRPRRIAGPGFVLVGDGAGLARDLSGEGIGPAVRSASLAAAAIGAGTPEAYPAALERVYGRPSRVVQRLAGWLPDRVLLGAARVACANPWVRRRLLLEGAFGMG